MAFLYLCHNACMCSVLPRTLLFLYCGALCFYSKTFSCASFVLCCCCGCCCFCFAALLLLSLLLSLLFSLLEANGLHVPFCVYLIFLYVYLFLFVFSLCSFHFLRANQWLDFVSYSLTHKKNIIFLTSSFGAKYLLFP
jgi:hypothetical protein